MGSSATPGLLVMVIPMRAQALDLVGKQGQGDGDVIRLTGLYHNLLRRWADA